MYSTIQNSKLSAKICTKGAELISLQNSDSKEYIWEGNPSFWGKHSPVLFPIVGSLKGNQFTYNEIAYQLSRHGFARDCDFQIVSQTSSTIIFSLHSDSNTLKVYPFKFELQIQYKLDENELFIRYKIKNNDENTIPFSIGGHPAFALTKPFENYTLEFEKEEKLLAYSLENDLLSDKTFLISSTNKKVPLTYSLFKNDALIFKKLNSKRISILENNFPIVHFKFHDFPNFGIWTKNNAPFICLEPWMGYSDTVGSSGNILEKEGIQFLDLKKTFECQFSIEIV